MKLDEWRMISELESDIELETLLNYVNVRFSEYTKIIARIESQIFKKHFDLGCVLFEELIKLYIEMVCSKNYEVNQYSDEEIKTVKDTAIELFSKYKFNSKLSG